MSHRITLEFYFEPNVYRREIALPYRLVEGDYLVFADGHVGTVSSVEVHIETGAFIASLDYAGIEDMWHKGFVSSEVERRFMDDMGFVLVEEHAAAP